MTRWGRGEAVVEGLLKAGDLQSVKGAQADGGPSIDKAAKTAATSRALVETDPASAVTLAYDAARFAAAGVLAQQGLRATTRGGHLAIDEAIRAQFGDAFRGPAYSQHDGVWR